MRSKPILIAAMASALTLAGCEESGDPDTIEVPVEGAQGAADTAAVALTESEGATPMGERVATIGLLNKRNNKSVDLELRPGETREEGAVIVRLSACERTAPQEMPQETGAFVQVDVLERGDSEHTRVFSGWLFKESPSLNVVEHPVYDVWVKECTMRFPGEAELPESDPEDSEESAEEPADNEA